jgi:hypothetical protein
MVSCLSFGVHYIHCKKKELYGTSKKGSADDKKLANMFKVSKKE